MAIDAAALRVVVSADTSKAEGDLKSFSGTMKGMAGGMAAVGGMLTAGIAAPLIGIGVSAIKTAATFEKSMNVLQYVTGSTTDTMQTMQDQALQLGADTVFSAGEAAEGMVALGKAGMDTEDIMGAIPGVMDLAAAGQIEVAEAADLTAATLATFGLAAEDSTKIADLLAAAANASTADVRDLAFGVANAGSVFAAVDQPVENLATMMALLANNGLNASDAATSLKTMTMRLTAPTEKAANVMKRLGINVFDAEGNMRDYQDIIGDLELATKSLSDEQQAAAFNTIFGADAIRAAIIMSKEGVAGFEAMETAVTEQGAAAAMAEAQNSGLDGAIKSMEGSIESLQIKLALPFLETIAGWMEKLTELVNKMGEIPQPVVEATLVFLGIAGAAGLAMVAISGVAIAIGALKTAGMLGIVGPMLGVVLGLAAAVALLWWAWDTNWGNIQEKTEEALGAINPLLETASGALASAATNLGALLAVNPQFQSFIENVEDAMTAAIGLGSAVRTIKMPDLTKLDTSTLKTNIQMQLVATVKNLQLDWSELKVNFSGLMTKVGEQLTAASEQAFGADNIVTRTINRIKDTFATIQDDFSGITMDEPIAAMKAVFDAALQINSLFAGVKTDVLTTAMTSLQTLMTTALNFATTIVEGIDEKVLADAASGFVTGFTDQIVKVFEDTERLANLGIAIGTFVTTIGAKVSEAFLAEDFGLKIGEAIGGATAAFIAGATALVGGLMTEVGKVSISEFQADMDNFTKGFITGAVTGLASQDWTVIGTTIRDAIVASVVQAFVDKNLFELVMPGPAGVVAGEAAEKAGFPSIGELLGKLSRGPQVVSDFFTPGDQAAAGTEMGAAFNSAVAPAGATLGTEVAAAVSKEAGILLPPLSKEAGILLPPLDMANAGADIGTAFNSAVASVGTEIGKQAGAAIATVTSAATSTSDILRDRALPSLEVEDIPTFEWPALPTFSWPPLPTWEWPEPVSLYRWQFPEPSQLYAWDWPNMSMPGWVGTLIGALGAAQSAVTSAAPTKTTAPVTTTRTAGFSAAGGEVAMASGVTIILENVHVANGMDIEVLAAQLARRFQQKMRA
jgi:TP901 family phage tail tape measure protein